MEKKPVRGTNQSGCEFKNLILTKRGTAEFIQTDPIIVSMVLAAQVTLHLVFWCFLAKCNLGVVVNFYSAVFMSTDFDFLSKNQMFYNSFSCFELMTKKGKVSLNASLSGWNESCNFAEQ